MAKNMGFVLLQLLVKDFDIVLVSWDIVANNHKLDTFKY
jgi:hypothetical protein